MLWWDMIIQKNLHFTIFKKRKGSMLSLKTLCWVSIRRKWILYRWYYLIESHVVSHTSRYHSNRQQPQLTNHVLSDVSHSVEFFLTDFTWELLFCIAMYNFDVLMQWPELLKRLAAGNTLKNNNNKNV